MQQVYIPLEQTWDTLEEAIDYFVKVAADLKVLENLIDLPTYLYLTIDTRDDDLDTAITEAGPDIILRNL